MSRLGIEYKKDNHTYLVALTAVSDEVFADAAAVQDIRNKEGEELVAALLASSKGRIFRLERYTDGILNDSPSGDFAVQEYDQHGKLGGARSYKDGILLRAERYKDGALNDGANGEPAVLQYGANGEVTEKKSCRNGRLLKSEERKGGLLVIQQYNEKGGLETTWRYKDGRLQDDALGVAAVIQYDSKKELVGMWHYQGGLLNDSRAGEPAFKSYRNGLCVETTRHKDGFISDGARGEPAHIRCDDKMRVTDIDHYKNGKVSDGAKGEPAVQRFNEKGLLVYAASYREGVLARVLTEEERRDYQLKMVRQGKGPREGGAATTPVRHDGRVDIGFGSKARWLNP